MAKKTHGKTASGVPITGELIDKLADETSAVIRKALRRYLEAG